MNVSDINLEFIYNNLVTNIRSLKDTSIEDDDIIFLFSISKDRIKRVMDGKSKYLDKNRLKNRKILGSNIYIDFYKLIRTPSFLIKLQQLFSISDVVIKTQSLNLFNGIFKTILTNENNYPSLVNKPGVVPKNDNVKFLHSYINNYNVKNNSVFFHNLVLNGYHEDNKPIVPKMLLSLYLEACIYMYHELINPIKNTFEHSLSINNMPNDLEFKSKIGSWLNNRLNVINKLNNTTKKLYIYKKNGSKYEITNNFLTFEYFDLSYFYSFDDIKKIKSLCYLRTESHVKRRDETYKMIEQFFKNPLYVSVDKAKFDDKESMEFLIFQAVHTYDQIINQLVQTRYEYLVSLRSMISKQENIDDEIEKIITTLQMYLNYPFCFQYKFSDFDTCKYIYSEDTMKVLLEKYLKLALVYSYCKENDIDMFKDPLAPPPPFQINDMSIKTKFIWDDITEQNNRNRLRKILVKINESINEMSSHLPTNVTDLSNRLKTSLLIILKNIFDSPMNTLNNEYLVNFQEGNIQSYIEKFRTSRVNIKKITEIDTTDPHIINIITAFTYENKFKNINDKIKEYNEELDIIRKTLIKIQTDKNNLFLRLNLLQESYFKSLKSLIDKNNDNDWTIGNTFHNEVKSYIDSNANIDYNTVTTTQNNLIKQMEINQYYIGGYFGYIKKVLKDLTKLLTDLDSLVIQLPVKRDEIITLSNNLINDLNIKKKYIDSEKSRLGSENTKLNREITTLTTEIDTLTVEITTLNTEISALKAKTTTIPPTITSAEKAELNNKITQMGTKNLEKTTKENNKNQKNTTIRYNTSEIKNYTVIINSIHNFVSINPELIEIINYEKTYSTHFTDIQTYITLLKNTINNNPVAQNYTNLFSNLQKIFYEIGEFANSLSKQRTLNFTLTPKSELHQVKCEMFNMLNVINHNYLYKRTDHNGITNIGDTYLYCGISQKSVATMMMINQLFKNNKESNNSYDNVNIADFTLDANADTSKSDNINFTLNKFSAYFENNLENLGSKNFQTKYKVSETISNNINSYQLIDYFNKNCILNMGEKLYYFLVANGNIELLPDIDTIIDQLKSNSIINYTISNVEELYNYLKSSGYINPLPNINDIIEQIKINSDDYNSVDNLYNFLILNNHMTEKGKEPSEIQKIKLKIYELKNKLFFINKDLLINKYNLMHDGDLKNINNLDIELFLNKFSDVSIQNVIKNIIILPNDNHNRIMFHLTHIFTLINEFDETKFIKKYFKEIRNANVLSSSNMSEFKHKTIPYDDLFYYRQNMNFNYVDNKLSPYYYGFFSLGNLCDFTGRRFLGTKIEEYSNKLNEVAVQIIEFTNGML
jgi:hypothetical protein